VEEVWGDDSAGELVNLSEGSPFLGDNIGVPIVVPIPAQGEEREGIAVVNNPSLVVYSPEPAEEVAPGKRNA
jgi:hypothetical protein